MRYPHQYAENVFNTYIAQDARAAVRLIKTAYTKEAAAFLAASVAIMLQRLDNGDQLAAEFLAMLTPQEKPKRGTHES